MKNDKLNLVASVLEVKASGIDNDILNDLQLPDGKSIAELLNEKKEKNNKTQCNE
jgi:hypothetical protein